MATTLSSVIPTLTGPRDECTNIGLLLSARHVGRMIEAIERDPTEVVEDWKALVQQLEQRIEDECESRLFLYISEEKAQYYGKPLLFGQQVSDYFPSVAGDIEEAGKCFALERNTACVFHLMRVLEGGLRVIGKALGIRHSPTWDACLRRINEKIQSKPKRRGIRWKTDGEFFSQAAAHLHAVKVAWRNPTMHIGRSYNADEAEDIFRAVRVFMRHLATRLKEKE